MLDRANSSIYKEVSEQITVLLVARDLGLDVNRAGFMLCPVHKERTPSCKLYPHHWHCFGCGGHGDAIDLVSLVEGVSKWDAVKILDSRYGLGVLGRSSERIRIRPKREPTQDAETVKRITDSVADIAYGARQAGIEEDDIQWIDDLHQQMLEDSDLMKMNPEMYMKKWKKVFHELQEFKERYGKIVDDYSEGYCDRERLRTAVEELFRQGRADYEQENEGVSCRCYADSVQRDDNGTLGESASIG